MKTDVVIGCDAVHPGPEAVRLETTSGETLTIPWKHVTIAGTSSRLETHIAAKAVADKVLPYLSTHQSVWIIYATDAFVRVMLERSSPKRDALLSEFERHLGDRWKGEALTEDDLVGPMLIPPKVQMPKSIVALMAVVAIAFFPAIIVLFFVHGAKPMAP